jgi:hypothetical protein
MDGHWEGDTWVTPRHTYSKTDNGEWIDETGKYVATAVPGDARPQGGQPRRGVGPGRREMPGINKQKV